MSKKVLDDWKLEYEELPKKVKKSKEKKMTKHTIKKTYNKSQAEHYKDIVIAVLVTGIVAFIAGLQY